MRLLLLKEKYLELLEAGSTLDALKCLRCEIAPLHLHHCDKDVQVLARCVCSDCYAILTSSPFLFLVIAT